VTHGHDGSDVMRNATKAAMRTGNWSPAKQEFAHRVTRSGTLVKDQASKKSAAGSSQPSFHAPDQPSHKRT
jgi:hypothetical protein